MEAKQKAEELYNKMKFEIEYNSQPSTVHGMSKKLALIAVEEQLDNANQCQSRYKTDYDRVCIRQYWLEVKKHLTEK